MDASQYLDSLKLFPRETVSYWQNDDYCNGLINFFKEDDECSRNAFAFSTISTSTILTIEQVRTNIGLADTLIPSSFIYLIYMGGTGPCDSFKIIFGYHVNS